jgi:LmbE family N-acetylglucosaminyl deacetylase
MNLKAGPAIPTFRTLGDRPLRILLVGAHPDDGEVKAAGTTALWTDRGHQVKIVSLTDGRYGHHENDPDSLVFRRKREAAESAKILGATELVLNNRDGALEAGIRQREEVVSLIREWKADIVITHRPNDYHADHRYTSILVQDASFLVTVPNFVPEVPRLEVMPVFLYFQDTFRKPYSFQPDVMVDIDSVVGRKLDCYQAMPSQFLEWLPWVAGFAGEIPEGESAEARENFIKRRFLVRDEAVADRFREELIATYGRERGEKVRRAEAFELCEYGSQPDPAELRGLFPF